MYDDELMRLRSIKGLSECDLDLVSFANELTALHDGYLQFLTNFKMTRSDINRNLWHFVHA